MVHHPNGYKKGANIVGNNRMNSSLSGPGGKIEQEVLHD